MMSVEVLTGDLEVDLLADEREAGTPREPGLAVPG